MQMIVGEERHLQWFSKWAFDKREEASMETCLWLGHLLPQKGSSEKRNTTVNMISHFKHYLLHADSAAKRRTFEKDDQNAIVITTNVLEHFCMQIPSLDG